jgi:dTDP-glucose pyrophosphorylase
MIINNHLISQNQTVFECLNQLNSLRTDLNLFIVDDERRLLGSVTDGDIRRGIIRGVSLNGNVKEVMNADCKYLVAGKIDLQAIIGYRKKEIKILPVVDGRKRIVDLLNFNKVKTLLPLDAVIMAGGKGSRLLPLTQTVPKPLLYVGPKPILAYNLERMQNYGIRNITITVNYLSDQVERFVSDLTFSGDNITCLKEANEMGTVGAVSLIDKWSNDNILLTNSDLLTNIDYEDFFLDFINSGADMMVAAIPYPLKVPYAILETEGNSIKAFKEKPEYTFYANTGMYIFKKEMLRYIPVNSFFNATDLMDKLLQHDHKLAYYPMINYWLDIGNHDDYKKAQEDIKHINF